MAWGEYTKFKIPRDCVVGIDSAMKERSLSQWYKLFQLDTFNSKEISMNEETVKTSLVQKYRDSQLTEPIKTLKAAGVLNNEGSFTRDGWDLFTQWLLKKFGDEFKTEVVDKLVEQPKA